MISIRHVTKAFGKNAAIDDFSLDRCRRTCCAARSQRKRENNQVFHERFQVRWLKPIGFNNTYAVMMRSEDAKRLGISTISDLSNHLNSN